MKIFNQQKDKEWALLFVAWFVALISSLGSLFFSEVMKYPPCTLCWYQRICMYPLVPIFLVSLFPMDKSVLKFVTPLVIIGWGIAFYHNLLYYKILPASAAPCRQGISCTTVYFELFGFMTIPFLSQLGFSLILICLILIYRNNKHEK